MQPLVTLNYFKPGPQPQMKGVTQNNLGAQLLKHGWWHPFYCAVSAHWHEDGRKYFPVSKGKPTRTRLAVLGLFLEKRGARGFDVHLIVAM